jgi:hypothetical protein
VITRDFEWIRSVHPETRSLEKWMEEIGYTGTPRNSVLKNAEDGTNELNLSPQAIQL